MKIYLAGAMTGLPKLNSDEFARVTKILRGGGHEVYSPAEAFPHDQPFCHKTAWPEYAKALAASDAIVLMDNWRGSLGAKAEYLLAMNLKLRVFYMDKLPLNEREVLVERDVGSCRLSVLSYERDVHFIEAFQ